MTSRQLFEDMIDPEDFFCSISNYSRDRKILTIHVFKQANQDQPQEFYVHFGGVEYFEGPTTWQGAAFYVGSDDECLELLNPDESESASTIEKLNAGQIVLYKVAASRGRTIRIVGTYSFYRGEDADYRTILPMKYEDLIERIRKIKGIG